jgi:tRNA-2-methylthio-N6-dimethylallyladenosine synthase
VSLKYLIETYGCQMNYHDSEQMAGLLESAGYERTRDDADADVVVINTCSVREHAEEKLYTRLGELRVLRDETGRDPIVAVAGCVAQQEGESLTARSPMVDVVVGTRRTRMLPMLIDQAISTRRTQFDLGAHDNVAFPFGLTRRGDPVRAWVTIIEGCNEYCSFCVVPYTRGHERMRPKAEVLAEVREAAARGLREVQLLGQIVNHYQAPDDPGCDFGIRAT